MKMQGHAHARVMAAILLIEHSLAGWRGGLIKYRLETPAWQESGEFTAVGFLGKWVEEQSSLETGKSVRGVLEEW